MKTTKKQQIESKAKELFWKHGFKKVTVDEICRKANVSRKSFYTFYDNKTALVLFILKQLSDKAFDDTRAIIDGEGSFAQKLQKMLLIKFDQSKDFSMEFISDFYHPDATEILDFFNGIVTESLKLISDFYKSAQNKGEMNPNLDIHFVLWMMQKQIEICSSPECMALFPNVESMTLQLSQNMIYGIMPVEEIHN